MPPTATLAALVFALAAGPALAADLDPSGPAAQALMARQAHFRDQNTAFRAINDELRKEPSDKAALTAGVAKLKSLSEALPSWFPKGSGPETGLPTRARPEIWINAEGFATAAGGFQAEAARLDQLAAAGDLDAVKAQVRAVNGACKTCHDQFRGPEAGH